MPPKPRERRNSRSDSPGEPKETTEKVVFINRCAKVVKGGRRFSFSALIVSGDHKGKVGVGFGKANEVSEAIRKATDASKKHMVKISVRENTIPHEVIGEFGGYRVPGLRREERDADDVGIAQAEVGGPLQLDQTGLAGGEGSFDGRGCGGSGGLDLPGG